MNKPISIHRRQFLAASTTLATGAMMAGMPGRVLATESEDPYGGFPLGIQSYSLRNYDVQQAVRHIQGMGLRRVEMYEAHFSTSSSPEQIAALLELLEGADISLVAHGVNEFTADHEANRKQFEFARNAGFKTMTANPLAESFDSLDKLCEEYQVRIAIHNHGPDSRYDKLTDVTSAIKGRHQLIGACVDTGHVLRSNEDPIKWLYELGDRVYGGHVKDVASKESRTRTVVVGTGHLDLVAMFQALREIDFPADGALSMEYEDNPENPIDDIEQCLAASRAAIATAAE